MEKNIIVQKIKRIEGSALDKAIRYYTILAAINDIHLTEREIQLVAFTAIKGNISYSSHKEEFCQLYKSSFPTIYNMIKDLKKNNILIKDAGKVKVNPAIVIDFNKNLIIQLSLNVQTSQP